MYKSLTALAILALPGCSILGRPAADTAAELISYYCETESATVRSMYRSMINEALEPYGHEVAIVCYGAR